MICILFLDFVGFVIAKLGGTLDLFPGGLLPYKRLMGKQNQFDSKAGTTARAIETLMGQYFD